MASMSVSAATPTSPAAVPATKTAPTKAAGDAKPAENKADAKENASENAEAPAAPAATGAASGQPSNAPPYATSASLYVGELDPEVSEAQLFELFNHIGPVASIRVCRDAVTRRSLGYAYVNFHNMADAERAMETFNYQQIKGKACRIMWSQRDPALRKGGSGNIFIKNLDRLVDNKALHDTFAAFGNILSCKVATDENGESRGHGFVHYETQEAADNAIKHVNGMLLNDKKVYVGAHVPKRERDTQVEAAKRTFTNVYVKNLDETITEDELREMFKPYGVLTSVAIGRDESEKSKGFAFINFEKHEEAEKACEEMNGKEVKGKALFVSRAQKKAEREEELRRKYEAAKQEKMNKFAGVNLYVKNLTDKMDDDMLRSEFANYGTITSAKIMVDEKGNSKGFGFVCFSSADEATRAVTEMNQRMFDNKPMYVALAQRKDQRKQQLEQQYASRSGVRGMQQPMIPGVTMPYGMPYYPGGPGMPQVGRQPMMYPPQMAGMPRPRFPAGPAGPGQVRPMPGMAFPQMPGGMPFMAGPQVMPGGQRGAQRGGPRGQPGMPGQGQMPMAGQPNVGSPQQGGMNPAAAAAAQQQARRGNYKFTSTARNNTGREGGAGQTPGQSGEAGGEVAITSMLASMPLAQQKQTLGEKLYPAVQTDLNVRGKRELAGKITGMLLEMDNGELLHLLEEEDALKEKIGEALDVLDRHQAKLQEQATSSKAE